MSNNLQEQTVTRIDDVIAWINYHKGDVDSGALRDACNDAAHAAAHAAGICMPRGITGRSLLTLDFACCLAGVPGRLRKIRWLDETPTGQAYRAAGQVSP